MSRFVGIIDCYKILENNDGYIVINCKGEYCNHSHFKKLSTCYLIIRLVKSRRIPNKPYMIEAAIRLTTDELYRKTLINKQDKNRQKLKYFNSNKGLRR